MHTFPRNTYSWRHEGLACTERAQQLATLERQPAGKQSENASGTPGPVARQQAVRQKRHRQTRLSSMAADSRCISYDSDYA